VSIAASLLSVAFGLDYGDLFAWVEALAGARIDKCADEIEGAREGLTAAEACEVAEADPSLIAIRLGALAPGWGPLSHMGGGVLQAHPLEGRVGLMVEEGTVVLVHTEDGEQLSDELPLSDLPTAVAAADKLNARFVAIEALVRRFGSVEVIICEHANGSDVLHLDARAGSCELAEAGQRVDIEPPTVAEATRWVAQGHTGAPGEGVEVDTLTDDQLDRMVRAMEAEGSARWAGLARAALAGDEGARRSCATHIRGL
jgi:hypothetical protein